MGYYLTLSMLEIMKGEMTCLKLVGTISGLALF